MITSVMQQKLNDVALTPGPDDSVSKLEFSPTADFLAVASWDSQVSVCAVAAQASSQLILLPSLPVPDIPNRFCHWNVRSESRNPT
jgi:hypothetical protein